MNASRNSFERRSLPGLGGDVSPRTMRASVRRLCRAFTLVELLVVISILGLLAALTVPALKNLGKSNVAVSAARQLLDDVGRARQLAISHRSTVYMVFLPTNFWGQMTLPLSSATYTPAQLTIITNLMAQQLTAYTFVSLGQVGDQPGQHQWQYLAEWQTLPDNSFISGWKFANPVEPVTFPDLNGGFFSIRPFDFTNTIPFPTADTNVLSILPAQNAVLGYIAFNYLGQVVSSQNDQDRAGNGIDIPLSQGTVPYAYNGNTKTAYLTNVVDVTENPPGNSTNIAYNVLHIDPLTGRAKLQFFKMQ